MEAGEVGARGLVIYSMVRSGGTRSYTKEG